MAAITECHNSCPLASGCAAWRRYQRNTLLRQLYTSVGSLSKTIWLLDCQQPPIGFELQYAMVRRIRALEVEVPGTAAGLSTAIKSALNS